LDDAAFGIAGGVRPEGERGKRSAIRISTIAQMDALCPNA
jgi:hypothetical protein